MASQPPPTGSAVRFEPHENPSNPVTIGLAAQYCLLTLGPIVLTVAIVVRTAGASELFLSWAACAALLVSGITTMVQARRFGRFGSGYILLMGTSGAFIAVSVGALAQGGPGMLATLVAASALFQFLLASRLSLLRRLITPTVAGTVIMLIAVTVMPLVLDLVERVPEGAAPAAGPMTALVTLGVTMVIVLRAAGALRLWGPVIGIVAGSVVAGFFGLFSWDAVAAAPWFGLPVAGWPGFDFSFGPVFWALLPAFVFVTLVGAIETIGDSVAVQRVSWRDERATDFRSVQGAVMADGLGNFLSGLLATVPNTTYSSSVSIVEITGVAARRVGVDIGVGFCALALMPKLVAVILSIPDSIIGAYVVVLIAILFVLGMRIVVNDGMDYRKAAIVGVSFWVGYGFQSGSLFIDQMHPFFAEMLSNGMTSGGLTALVLSAFVELAGPRRKRLVTTLSVDALAEIRTFLEGFGARAGWRDEAVERVQLAAEEALVSLMGDDGEEAVPARRLRLSVRSERGSAELELAAVAGEGNLEDRLAVSGEPSVEIAAEHDFSLRLLRHLAASVRHQKYHDTDILTVRVDLPRT
ncbi:MAG: hypothetical protein OXU69_11660 [Gemmatimonadota bacterium]|nr:hypothetical protein [Gemmatimonadota bacterium]MDE2985351.1 hypothetical protein [Gemmatimonadota bacterium]